jgi:hypothetical protein
MGEKLEKNTKLRKGLSCSHNCLMQNSDDLKSLKSHGHLFVYKMNVKLKEEDQNKYKMIIFLYTLFVLCHSIDHANAQSIP